MSKAPIAILHALDGTPLNVTADYRLQVDARVASAGAGVVASYLLNGSSAEMAINGGAGVIFAWSPGPDHDIQGMALSLILEDATIYFGEKYAGIDGLANGVLIEAKAQDEIYTLANVRLTRELFQLCLPGGFSLYSATPDCCRASLGLEGLVFAKSGTYPVADYVRVTIRDDLTGLTHQSALLNGLEV